MKSALYGRSPKEALRESWPTIKSDRCEKCSSGLPATASICAIGRPPQSVRS